MRQILLAQIVLIGAAAAYFGLRDTHAGLSALYGGGIAVGNSLLMAWRWARQSRERSSSPRSDVAGFYLGAMQRFVFTLLAMALGMGALGLDPISLLVAFVAAQIGLLFGARPLAGGAWQGGSRAGSHNRGSHGE